MATRRKNKIGEGAACPGRTYSEYLGDVTPGTANEMLTSLTNVNRCVNSIRDAKDETYMAILLHDAEGKFVGLVLVPDNARYWIEGKVIRPVGRTAGKRCNKRDDNQHTQRLNRVEDR